MNLMIIIKQKIHKNERLEIYVNTINTNQLVNDCVNRIRCRKKHSINYPFLHIYPEIKEQYVLFDTR